MKRQGSVLDRLTDETFWQQFLDDKLEKQHLRREEENKIRSYIENRTYEKMAELIREGLFPGEYPVKKVINKEGTTKKRVVYSFGDDVSITLKFIAFHMDFMEDVLADSCYAFRKTRGVSQALQRLRRNPKVKEMYCYKADISNYFNSIDIPILLEALGPLKERDVRLYELMEKILMQDKVRYHGKLIQDEHGAMAGLPIAPFWANMYLNKVDHFFEQQGIEYYRYSDDILIFTESELQLTEQMETLRRKLQEYKLTINASKESVSHPGEAWEFLGFSYKQGEFDLSDNTKRKMKAKIKRKAEALRRWQRKKGLAPDKAAIGFIHAMNRKFYGGEGTDDFTWSRWFFPNLTLDCGLREIDSHMQEYIRYAVTGRHYKGNYRITYEQMKTWGYRNLVHEFYAYKKDAEEFAKE
nr:hypothetical protein [Lachnospiraceae bacterium]